MTEKTKDKVEKKEETKVEHAHKEKTEEIKEEKKNVDKVEVEKKEKKEKVAKVKKEEAVAKGFGIHASLKHSMAISRFIKNKNIDLAIVQLEEVIAMKRAIPFKGEIPHRKGDMMSGRYPVNACKAFIPMLKSLKGNVIANGMDLDSSAIVYASPSWASRPMRRGGMKGNRVNIIIKAKEIKKNG